MSLFLFANVCPESESLRSSEDSDLEAFSHNPTDMDGSFAPLANQPSAYANCLNLRFLSY